MPWQRHMSVIYLSSGLIFLRSIVRLAEYLEGFTGYIMTNEWCLYILDFLPMVFIALVYVWIHPSEINAWLKGGVSISGWKLQKQYPVLFASSSHGHMPLV